MNTLLESSWLTASEATTMGVFPATIDQCAFLDTVRLGVFGGRRESPLLVVRDVGKEPIAKRGGLYGWVERGVVESTGNRYELLYGALRMQKIIPPLVLTLRSDQKPVTVEDAIAAINAFCETVAPRVTVSQTELTFDLSGVSVDWFERSIFSSARRFVPYPSEEKKETLYVGGPTSPWHAYLPEDTEGDAI